MQNADARESRTGTLLEEVAASIGPLPSVTYVNHRDVLPARLAATELALSSVAAASAAAATLVAARCGGRPPSVVVDGYKVSAAFRSDHLLRINGREVERFAPLSGFWRASNGWVRTHANYPHHRRRLLRALDLPTDVGVEELARAIAARDAVAVEDAVAGAGGACAAVRTPNEWQDHPQATAVRSLPVLSVESVADAPTRCLPLPTPPSLPLADVRILDLTRVIAGPVATRTLALLGGDVLRIDPPRLPEIEWQYLDTGMDKRSAVLDLTNTEQLHRLLDAADVVVLGYRPRALDQFGLAPDRLTDRWPGLVVATLSAWGPVGPWRDRRGFDSIVQAATGVSVTESVDGERPGALPAQALDHATGYLIAAGVIAALTRQLSDGGSFHVHAHLSRTAAWLADHADSQSRRLPDVEHLMCERTTPSGLLRYPPPAIGFRGAPEEWTAVGSLFGSSPPSWR